MTMRWGPGRRVGAWLAAGAVAGAIAVGSGGAGAQESGGATASPSVRDHLQLGLGHFSVFDGGEESLDLGAIYRPGVRYLDLGAAPGDVWRGVGAQVGARVNTDGGALAHAGVFLDIRPLDDVVVWPGLSVAAWERGSSRDLGGTLQFVSELYLGYRLPWRDLVGVSLQHVSNAGLHDRNPGADTLLVTYTLSFAPLLGD